MKRKIDVSDGQVAYGQFALDENGNRKKVVRLEQEYWNGLLVGETHIYEDGTTKEQRSWYFEQNADDTCHGCCR